MPIIKCIFIGNIRVALKGPTIEKTQRQLKAMHVQNNYDKCAPASSSDVCLLQEVTPTARSMTQNSHLPAFFRATDFLTEENVCICCDCVYLLYYFACA